MKKEDRAKEVCKGCELSEGNGDPPGSIIVKLDGGWILNHYGGPEGFLGWLALQPKRHLMELAQLNEEETSHLGRNIQRVDMALRHYWAVHFPNDQLERVYSVYFFESVYDEPPTKYHLHLHLIPRTRKMVGKKHPSDIAAWKIRELVKSRGFPKGYQTKDRGNDMYEEEVVALMTCLKLHLDP